MIRIIFLCLAIGSMIGCSKKPGSKDQDSSGPAGISDADKAKSLASAKPDHTFTAQAWFEECKKDPAAAKAKYKDKVIEVEGEVSSVVDQTTNPPMALIHLKVEKDILGVRADCTPADLWKTVFPKSKTVVRGYHGENSFLTGELYPCVVVKTDGKVESFKAAELAAEVSKDRKAAAEKYKEKWCWVEGKMLSTKKDNLGVNILVIEGVGKDNIECGIPAEAAAKFKALKPGATVKVFGELTVFEFSDGISLSQSRIE
jgi:hypothetical protein